MASTPSTGTSSSSNNVPSGTSTDAQDMDVDILQVQETSTTNQNGLLLFAGKHDLCNSMPSDLTQDLLQVWDHLLYHNKLCLSINFGLLDGFATGYSKRSRYIARRTFRRRSALVAWELEFGQVQTDSNWIQQRLCCVKPGKYLIKVKFCQFYRILAVFNRLRGNRLV